VTGLHLIEACNGDVAMAIGMHMDTVGNAAAPVTSVEQNANQEPLAAHPSFSSESSSSEVYDNFWILWLNFNWTCMLEHICDARGVAKMMFCCQFWM